jgi:hypothetical protein
MVIFEDGDLILLSETLEFCFMMDIPSSSAFFQQLAFLRFVSLLFDNQASSLHWTVR